MVGDGTPTIGGFFAWLMTMPNPDYSGRQTTIGGFFAWLVTEHIFNIELKENLKNNIPFKTNQK
jgi:hypothetical protein